MQIVHRARWIKNVALALCALWVAFVLGIGAAVYFHKPWGHDPFVRLNAGQHAHCLRPTVGGQAQPASYDWSEIAKCDPKYLVPAIEPTAEFMYGRMLVTAFTPPLSIWLFAYAIAGAVRFALGRQSRSTT